MFPFCPMINCPNMASMDMELFCYTRTITSNKIVSYPKNVFIGKFCHVMIPAIRNSISSFMEHIFHIVCVGTYPKMFWIYARWIIATMKDKFSFWYISIFETIRNTVCVFRFPFCVNFSIAILIFISSPLPATGRFLNISEESCVKSMVHLTEAL
jgi:hypothetical protein